MFEQQPIRILITLIKMLIKLCNSSAYPGRPGQKTNQAYMLHDDEGDNIAEKPMYRDIIQYWAWKNIKCSLCWLGHYRRYFNFTDTVYPETRLV